jgi:hypothetical protein
VGGCIAYIVTQTMPVAIPFPAFRKADPFAQGVLARFLFFHFNFASTTAFPQAPSFGYPSPRGLHKRARFQREFKFLRSTIQTAEVPKIIVKEGPMHSSPRSSANPCPCPFLFPLLVTLHPSNQRLVTAKEEKKFQPYESHPFASTQIPPSTLNDTQVTESLHASALVLPKTKK